MSCPPAENGSFPATSTTSDHVGGSTSTDQQHHVVPAWLSADPDHPGPIEEVLKTYRQAQPLPLAAGTQVALKIIKNRPAYFHQALVELRILKMLNGWGREEERNGGGESKNHLRDHIVEMYDFFVYRQHLWIVFEMLSVNLYDVLRQVQKRLI